MAVKIASSRWRVWHRWLALIVGLQMVVWSISGAYMVFFKLPFIHGDHLVHQHDAVIQHGNHVASFNDVLKAYPEASQIQLTSQWLNHQWQPVYRISHHGMTELVDAQSIAVVELSQSDVQAIAEKMYALGEQPASRVQWLTENPPSELNPDHLPVWRVDFDDFGSTSLYFSPSTGELVTKRHTFWRGFDIMWMLHIMDYEERVDIESWLLRGFIIANFIFLITGAVLLVYTLRKPKPSLKTTTEGSA
ncbi:PepSY domain-containing protein [Pseudidiomarina sp.]|uniref:PepSY domain-containing protein n=1 Tax=Pseudidiomarina sp. TaxID=2081707 RepID=UPI003A96AA99